MTLHLSQIGGFDYLASFAAYFCILSVWGGKQFGEGSNLVPDLEDCKEW